MTPSEFDSDLSFWRDRSFWRVRIFQKRCEIGYKQGCKPVRFNGLNRTCTLWQSPISFREYTIYVELRPLFWKFIYFFFGFWTSLEPFLDPGSDRLSFTNCNLLTLVYKILSLYQLQLLYELLLLYTQMMLQLHC